MAVMVRGDAASDSRVAGSADHRGIPLDLGASLLGARQRPRLWTRLHVSGEGDGYPRSTDLSWVAVAEWLCRTSDRHTAPRVPGSNTHLRRGAPAASSFRLFGVLQSSTHPLGIRERCAFASSGPTIGRHCHHSSWLDCTTNTSGYDFRKGQAEVSTWARYFQKAFAEQRLAGSF